MEEYIKIYIINVQIFLYFISFYILYLYKLHIEVCKKYYTLYILGVQKSSELFL